MTGIYDALQQAQKMNGYPGASPDVVTTSVGATNSVDQTFVDLYFTLCSALDRPDGKIVAFVAPAERVGAGPLLSRLAISVAQKLARPVLLVNATGPARSNGFSAAPESLTGLAEPETLKQTLPKLGDCELYAMNIGWDEAAAAEENGRQGRTESRLDPLRAGFDVILLSLPPIETASAALALVREADGVVLVVEAERTRWQVAEAAKNRIESHGGKVIGVILNKRRHYIPRFLYNRL